MMTRITYCRGTGLKVAECPCLRCTPPAKP